METTTMEMTTMEKMAKLSGLQRFELYASAKLDLCDIVCDAVFEATDKRSAMRHVVGDSKATNAARSALLVSDRDRSIEALARMDGDCDFVQKLADIVTLVYTRVRYEVGVKYTFGLTGDWATQEILVNSALALALHQAEQAARTTDPRRHLTEFAALILHGRTHATTMLKTVYNIPF